jgi:hypothetical protein
MCFHKLVTCLSYLFNTRAVQRVKKIIQAYQLQLESATTLQSEL